MKNGTLEHSMRTNQQKRCQFQPLQWIKPASGTLGTLYTCLQGKSEDVLFNAKTWVLTHMNSGSCRYLSWLGILPNLLEFLSPTNLHANGSTMLVRMVQNSSSWTSCELVKIKMFEFLVGTSHLHRFRQPGNCPKVLPFFVVLNHPIYGFNTPMISYVIPYMTSVSKYMKHIIESHINVGHPELSRMFHSSAHVRPVPPDSTVFPHWVPRPVAMIGPEGVS